MNILGKMFDGILAILVSGCLTLILACGSTGVKRSGSTGTGSALLLATTTLPTAVVNVAYRAQLASTGGIGPLQWTVSSGSLPAGITLDTTTGMISGSSSATGIFSFVVTVTDSVSASAKEQLSLTVAHGIQIANNFVVGAITGTPYGVVFSSPDGIAPLTWSIATGNLPPGLNINASTGAVSGTPTTPGTFQFTLQVVDSNASASTRNIILIVSDGNPAYGRAGDAYADEGAGPDPKAAQISSCQKLSSNTSYVLTQDIGSAPGSTCLILAASDKLDLAGHTVTGRITMNENASGTILFNGIVNCNFTDTNTGNAGCIQINSDGAATAEARFHHLLISNASTGDGQPTGNGSRAFHLDWSTPTHATFPSVRLYHTTVTVIDQPLVSRSYALSLMGGNQFFEVSYNDLRCSPQANACQAISCYGAENCKMHGNHITMDHNTVGASGDTGRALLFDGGVNQGEAWNNNVIPNNNRGLRIRDSSNIVVHHNQFLNIGRGLDTPNYAGTLHLADPDAGALNDLHVLVEKNTFQFDPAQLNGLVVLIRNGFDATFHANTFTCNGVAGTCVGQIVEVRSPQAPGTVSDISVLDNPTATTIIAPPASALVQVDSGGTATVCNSGTTSGPVSSITVPPVCQ